MQVSNHQVSYNSYNTKQSNHSNATSSFESYLEDKSTFANTKLLTSDILSFIEKNNGFSGLSPENERLFKEILADDMISTQEIKNMSYEQAKAFNEFQKNSMNLDITSYIPVYKYEDSAVSNTLLATTITHDEKFNQAFFETLKTMNDTQQNSNFYKEVADSLGYNNRYMVVPEPKEEYFAQLMAMEIEKYKDYENPEHYMIDYTHWEIKDFGGFIKNMLKDYKERSSNALYSLEESVRYKSVFQTLLALDKNYNTIKK